MGVIYHVVKGNDNNVVECSAYYPVKIAANHPVKKVITKETELSTRWYELQLRTGQFFVNDTCSGRELDSSDPGARVRFASTR